MAPTESTALADSLQTLKDAYGTDCHAKLATLDGEEHLVDYEPLKLSSFRVCCSVKVTILKDPVLFVEQLMLTILFFLSAAPVWFLFKADFSDRRGDISLRSFLDNQEGKMRAFAQIMTNLAAFLLSFYTSVSVTRWWVMRTGGIGGIKAAAVDLEWLLMQNVTEDEKVLSSVRRYARASLMLIFLWRQNKSNQEKKDYLVAHDLMSAEECDKLMLPPDHCLHEKIWVWQASIVSVLYQEGKCKSDQLYNLLIEKCLDGRAAVQLIHTHLAVRVPLQYVHLLGLLVKMHNFVCALIMGVLFGAAARSSEIIICIQLFARTLILPFLFNAILLINAELADPFNGGETDLPGPVYEKRLEEDCKGFVVATQTMPDWLAARASQA